MFSEASDGEVQNIYIRIFDGLPLRETCAIAGLGIIDGVGLSRQWTMASVVESHYGHAIRVSPET